jgi:hypothetical protein
MLEDHGMGLAAAHMASGTDNACFMYGMRAAAPMWDVNPSSGVHSSASQHHGQQQQQPWIFAAQQAPGAWGAGAQLLDAAHHGGCLSGIRKMNAHDRLMSPEKSHKRFCTRRDSPSKHTAEFVLHTKRLNSPYSARMRSGPLDDTLVREETLCARERLSFDPTESFLFSVHTWKPGFFFPDPCSAHTTSSCMHAASYKATSMSRCMLAGGAAGLAYVYAIFSVRASSERYFRYGMANCLYAVSMVCVPETMAHACVARDGMQSSVQHTHHKALRRSINAHMEKKTLTLLVVTQHHGQKKIFCLICWKRMTNILDVSPGSVLCRVYHPLPLSVFSGICLDCEKK